MIRTCCAVPQSHSALLPIDGFPGSPDTQATCRAIGFTADLPLVSA